jgi:hypothetical protein
MVEWKKSLVPDNNSRVKFSVNSAFPFYRALAHPFHVMEKVISNNGTSFIANIFRSSEISFFTS